MKRVSPNQRGHQTMLGAIASVLGDLSPFAALGMSDYSLATLAADAALYRDSVEHWRHAPFGSAKGGVKQNRRKAMKRRNVVRARKRGHA